MKTFLNHDIFLTLICYFNFGFFISIRFNLNESQYTGVLSNLIHPSVNLTIVCYFKHFFSFPASNLASTLITVRESTHLHFWSRTVFSILLSFLMMFSHRVQLLSLIVHTFHQRYATPLENQPNP